MTATSQTFNRASQRLKVFLPATVWLGATYSRAHLLDVSRTGALAHADLPPPTFSRVRVRCGPLDSSATVVWVSGKRFGLMFRTPLPPLLLAAVTEPCAPVRDARAPAQPA